MYDTEPLNTGVPDTGDKCKENPDEIENLFSDEKTWFLLLIYYLGKYEQEGNHETLLIPKPKPRQDCEYYDEEHDMGKSIPYCKRIGAYCDFDCENCPHYKMSERMIKLKKIVERIEKTMPKEELDV